MNQWFYRSNCKRTEILRTWLNVLRLKVKCIPTKNGTRPTSPCEMIQHMYRLAVLKPVMLTSAVNVSQAPSARSSYHSPLGPMPPTPDAVARNPTCILSPFDDQMLCAHLRVANVAFTTQSPY